MHNKSAVAAAAALCIAILRWLLLVAAAAVRRHRAPDGKICCCFIESHSNVLFLFIQTCYSIVIMYPLAVLSHLWPRFAYMLGNYGHAQSRRALAGRGEILLVFKYI